MKKYWTSLGFLFLLSFFSACTKSDAPLYPGSTQVGVTATDKAAHQTTSKYMTPDSFDQVVSYYKEHLPGSIQGTLTVPSVPGMTEPLVEPNTMFMVNKNNRSTLVQVQKDKESGKTSITITVKNE